jgi:hypothetical protein
MSRKKLEDSQSANQKNNDKREKPNRNIHDQSRDKKTYKYLLTLVDGYLENPDDVSISYIADQWGMADNRMFVSRVLKSIKNNFDALKEPPKNVTENSPDNINDILSEDKVVPGLTLNKLVNILVSIDKYRKEKCAAQEKISFPKLLTRSEKLRVLYLYSDTLPIEKKYLNLEESDTRLLLQQLINDITDSSQGLSQGKLNEICKYISSCMDIELSEGKNEKYTIKSIINENIEIFGYEYFQGLNEAVLKSLKNKIFEQVENAIQDISYQNGSYQFKAFLDKDINEKYSDEVSTESLIKHREEIGVRFSPKKFIRRLTKSIVENQILAEEFPVYLKYIEIQQIQQSMPQDDDYKDSLSAYTVKVHFYLKNAQGEREDFYEEVTGIGSPLSHAIAAMNRALLWDIKSLKDYIPIAKQITFNTEIIGSSNNGSIWGHYVVGLCKRPTNEDQKDMYCVEELASGDYCGFDTLEVYAKASFYARLRAIKKNGISPSKYIKELQDKIKQVKILRKGEEMLNGYPFSLEAMKFYLTTNLLVLNNCYKIDKDNFPLPDSAKKDSWSLTEYEAHLSIAEAYLVEGLYVIGKIYLDCIESHIENPKKNSISRIIIAKYHLCCFRYHYLTDLHDDNKTNLSRNDALSNATKHLDKSYDNLKEYVYKCNKIDELPYVNFYNFFTMMSKLYANKARLYFFMNHYLLVSEDTSESINLFEKSREYAEKCGDSLLYSMWSAYKSWCYLSAAYKDYKDDKNESIKSIDNAEKTLIQALRAYEKIGVKSYESVKLKSGKRNIPSSDSTRKFDIGYEDEDYGGVEIQGVPLIKEFIRKDDDISQVHFSSADASLTLNMSLLMSDLTTPPTPLFGTQSSIIIFAIAMLKLCHYQYDEKSIIVGIEEARKLFCYSWSFGEDGSCNMTNNKMKRWQEKEFSPSQEGCHLRGLYPHRLTQFADFGKIYFIACELILLSHSKKDKKERWTYIHELVHMIEDNSLEKGNRKEQTSQKRYNGHLQDHFNAIKEYVEDFKKLAPKSSILNTRNEVVKDFAIILRTGQKRRPNSSVL